MNDDNHPTEWLPVRGEDRPRPGKGLFSVDARAFEHHSILFAQSGSGKSFLVGRIIEELALKTRARLVIIDPNSDYSKLELIESRSFGGQYQVVEGHGVLTEEKHPDEFGPLWANVKPIMRFSEDIQISVPHLDPRLFLSTPGDRPGNDAVYAHTVIVLMAEFLERNWKVTSPTPEQPPTTEDLLKCVKELLTEKNGRLDPTKLRTEVTKCNEKWSKSLPFIGVSPDEMQANYNECERVKLQNNTTLEDLDYLSEVTTWSVLNSMAFEIHANRRNLVLKAPPNPFEKQGVFVVDKPSLPEALVHTSIQYLLDLLWEHHERIYRDGPINPTIVFIDEAHHLMPKDLEPSDPLNSTRETLRRIAAEGRKYGLFLFLISQRPDKLDPLVVSECENKIIMRVGNARAIEAAAPILGISARQLEQLEEAARFKMGRAFLIGPLCEHGRPKPGSGAGLSKFYVAARRTVEGSKKLNPNWRSAPAIDLNNEQGSAETRDGGTDK